VIVSPVQIFEPLDHEWERQPHNYKYFGPAYIEKAEVLPNSRLSDCSGASSPAAACWEHQLKGPVVSAGQQTGVHIGTGVLHMDRLFASAQT
jgi:hypothetical protein